MPRQLTVRNVPDEVDERLKKLSRAKGQSVNSTVLEILGEATGYSARRERLERYATWEVRDGAEFEAALRSQRVIDPDLWE